MCAQLIIPFNCEIFNASVSIKYVDTQTFEELAREVNEIKSSVTELFTRDKATENVCFEQLEVEINEIKKCLNKFTREKENNQENVLKSLHDSC